MKNKETPEKKQTEKSGKHESAPKDASSQGRPSPRGFREFYDESGKLKSLIEPVGKLIGYGKHSAVYQGRMTGSGQSVTIKIDERPILNTKAMQAQFNSVQAKVDRIKALDHPAISRLIDWIPDWENNRSYIIMQYIEGKSLDQELADAKEGKFPQGRVLDWACQILDAMKYLHRNRYIVGDLDSSNIVLTPKGNVRLVDFRYLTAMGRRVRGKPKKPEKGYFGRYHEDEQGEKALQAGIREDIYHLGETLYELLTGYDEEQHRPNAEKILLETQTPEEKKQALENREAKLSESGVSDTVAAVILKALSDEPNERYASAREMLDALQTLPVKDAHSNSQMAFFVIGALTAVILFALGLTSFTTGQRQIGRYAQMKADAASALTAFRENDYSRALREAGEATRTEDGDPPCPPEAKAALARIISAYDYIIGYKPYRSDYPLCGKPIEARFSPEGDRIAVLAEKADAYPSGKRIQFFDAASGAELCEPLTASYAGRSGFVFLDNDTLLYAGESAVRAYSISKGRDIMTGAPGSSDSRYPVGIALSADGTRAASILWGDGTAYLYDAQAILDGKPDAECWRAFPLEHPGIAAQTSFSLASTMDNFLALNGDGRYLALNFPDGGVGLYDCAPDAEKRYTEILSDSGYTRFEGGFYDDFFFYNASASSGLESRGDLYRLSDGKIILHLDRKAPVRIQADKDGVYLSIGDWLYSIDTEFFLWTPLVQTDGEIRLLRHIAGQDEQPGRLLAVTDSGFALVYRDNGAWKVEVAQGAFHIAGLSKDYLFLAQQDKPVLSVLKWNEPERKLLTYIKEDETESDIYEHLGAHVSADGGYVMLYRPTGFRVYRLADKEYDETTFEREAERVLCQRAPLYDGDPKVECLKAVYSNTVEFYSMRGELLSSRERRQEDDCALFVTKDYRVEQSAGGPVKISRGGRTEEWSADKLTDASQQGETLIVSLITDDKVPYSLLLDKNLAVTAELPEPCEAAPDDSGEENDGTLVFDDTQGHLFQGSLYSLEDLRKLAM